MNRNIFDNNYRGYFLSGSVLSETNQNTFIVMPENSAYGLYLEASTAYDVKENIFTKDDADLYVTAGMVINNSGTGDNLIYKNSFSLLNEGSIAMKVNGSSGPDHGLVLKCGDYQTSWIDMAVVTQGGVTGSIHPDQGGCLGFGETDYLTAPANNLFTDPEDITTHGQIFTSSGVSSIDYWFFKDDLADAAPFIRPAEYSTSITPSSCDDVTYDEEDRDDYCPTAFGSGGGRMANPDYTNLILEKSKGNQEDLFRETDDSLEENENEWLDNIMLHDQLRYFIANEMQDSIIYLLDGDESPIGLSVLSALAADSGDFTIANTFLTGLETEDAQQQGYSAELLAIALQLKEDSLTWMELDSMQLNVVTELAEYDTRIGIQAKHLLSLIYDFEYHEIMPVIDAEHEEIIRAIQQITNSGDEIISIYPNPVEKYGIVSVFIKDETESNQLLISDMHGRIIKEYDLKTGMNYFEISNTVLEPGVYLGYLSNHVRGNISKQFIIIQ
ncbi:MAG: T9SS type A sorting domain-containing protein [Chitinophagales bacterium]